MGVFDFQWLRGPGQSVAENFEILCLALLRAEHPNGNHQCIEAPDRDIDILGVEVVAAEKRAYECKAYQSFSAALTRAVGESLKQR